jgi:lysine 2,3-aminomutase
MDSVTNVLEEPPDAEASITSDSTTAVSAPISLTARLDKTAPRRVRPRFRLSERSAEFLATYYPEATIADWTDWRWQNRQRVRTLVDLQRMVDLSEDEIAAIRAHTGALPVGITPYYASLLDRSNPMQPLRRTVVPVLGEYDLTPGEAEDPLGEDGHSPVPGLVHRYPDRVLLLVGVLPLLHAGPHGGFRRRAQRQEDRHRSRAVVHREHARHS